jgi:hypothetical protein
MDADSHARALNSLISGLAAPSIRHGRPFSITIPVNISVETLRYRYNEFIVIFSYKNSWPYVVYRKKPNIVKIRIVIGSVYCTAENVT